MSTDHTVLVTLTIKSDSQEEAEEAAERRMNQWFTEYVNMFPNPPGTLLYWGHYKPKVVNGYE